MEELVRLLEAAIRALTDALTDNTRALERSDGVGGAVRATAGARSAPSSTSSGAGTPSGGTGGASASATGTTAARARSRFGKEAGELLGATKSGIAGATLTGIGSLGGRLGVADGAAIGATLGILGSVYDETVGFASNLAIKSARNAARTFVLSGAARASSFLFGTFNGRFVGTSQVAAGAISDALEGLPLIGQEVTRVREPRRNARDRLLGIFASGVRVGGNPSTELVDNIASRLITEEKRLARFEKRISGRFEADSGAEFIDVVNATTKALERLRLIVIAVATSFLKAK